jgi:hypothetical protein
MDIISTRFETYADAGQDDQPNDGQSDDGRGAHR